MFRTIALLLLLALGACAAIPSPPDEPTSVETYRTPVALGEWVWLDEPYTSIRADRLIGDSRCPPNARCIWAGEVKLAVRISHDSQAGAPTHHDNAMSVDVEIGSAQGTSLFGGQIDIERVDPPPAPTGETLEPHDYRFVFRFTPRRAAD